MSPSIYLETSITELLSRWLSQQLTPEGFIWLEEKRQQITGGAPGVFFRAFSVV